MGILAETVRELAAAPTLARVVEYMKFKTAHAGSRGPLPHFEVPPEAALELLVASNYLDV